MSRLLYSILDCSLLIRFSTEFNFRFSNQHFRIFDWRQILITQNHKMKNNLEALLNQLEHHILNCELINSQVSQSTVGWQIEHSLLTINGIIHAIVKSNPKDYNWKFSFMKLVVLATKKIPRGKAKAPKVVVPKAAINRDDLQEHLTKTRNTIKTLEMVSKDHFFEHPYFGKLKLKETIRFLEIHTGHHLNIIEDIVNNT